MSVMLLHIFNTYVQALLGDVGDAGTVHQLLLITIITIIIMPAPDCAPRPIMTSSGSKRGEMAATHSDLMQHSTM